MTCNHKCCCSTESKIPVQGDDRLTLQSSQVEEAGADHSYPDYFTWHVGGEAGGYSGLSFIQVTSKKGASYHTYILRGDDAGALRDWLDKHVEDSPYVGHRIV